LNIDGYFDLRDRAAIVSGGNSHHGRRLMRSSIDLAADAISKALEDSGLTREELDGTIVSFGSAIGADSDIIAQLLGLQLRICNQTWAHGRFTASISRMGRARREASSEDHVK
jgi:acetyl-CoA acetyltransferase